LPDPFPSDTSVPQITRDQVSGDVIGGGILHHGCVQVHGLIPSDAVDRLCEYIDRTFEGRERLANGDPPELAAPWYVPFEVGLGKVKRFGGDSYVRTVDAPRAMFELIELFTAAGVVDAVSAYFNERPAMIAHKWVLRRIPGGQLGTDFHQDGAFLGEGIRTVNCWIALSRCGPGTGKPGIDLIARRFESILTNREGAAFSWSISEQVALEAGAGAGVSSPVFEAGDALFFDERLAHRTTVGEELSTRYAVESWFVAPSSYPDKHVPVVL
jgi:hypothetical protein